MVRVDNLVDDVLDKVALLLEELDLAVAVLGGEDVYDVRQRVETRRRPPLVDPRQPFLQVGFVGRNWEAVEDAAAVAVHRAKGEARPCCRRGARSGEVGPRKDGVYLGSGNR
jgi:hypothetical protein